MIFVTCTLTQYCMCLAKGWWDIDSIIKPHCEIMKCVWSGALCELTVVRTSTSIAVSKNDLQHLISCKTTFRGVLASASPLVSHQIIWSSNTELNNADVRLEQYAHVCPCRGSREDPVHSQMEPPLTLKLHFSMVITAINITAHTFMALVIVCIIHCSGLLNYLIV